MGTILADQSITLNPGASLDGRQLALKGAITLGSNSVSVPVSAIPEPASTSLFVAGFFGLMIGARHFRQRRAAARAVAP